MMNKCLRWTGERYCNALISEGYSCSTHILRDRLRMTNDHSPASEGFPAYNPSDAWLVANHHKLIEFVQRNKLWTEYRQATEGQYTSLKNADAWSSFFELVG